MGEPSKARVVSGGGRGTSGTSGGTGRSGSPSATTKARVNTAPEKKTEPKGAERLRRKSDTDSGMTTAQRIAVNNWEEKHNKLPTERVVAIDEYGRKHAESKTGKSDETSLEGKVPRNCVITHNHPGAHKAGKWRGLGATLSGQDLFAAIYHDAKEIRVTAGRVTYSVRRPKSGWGVSAGVVKKAYQNRVQDALIDEMFSGYTDRGLTQEKRHNIAVQHAIIKDLAKKYGWEYTRKIRKK